MAAGSEILKVVGVIALGAGIIQMGRVVATEVDIFTANSETIGNLGQTTLDQKAEIKARTDKDSKDAANELIPGAILLAAGGGAWFINGAMKPAKPSSRFR